MEKKQYNNGSDMPKVAVVVKYIKDWDLFLKELYNNDPTAIDRIVRNHRVFMKDGTEYIKVSSMHDAHGMSFDDFRIEAPRLSDELLYIIAELKRQIKFKTGGK